MWGAEEARSVQDAQFGIGSIFLYTLADVKLRTIKPASFSTETRSKPQPPPHPPYSPPRRATAQPTQYKS